jgi:hypothetical protein
MLWKPPKRKPITNLRNLNRFHAVFRLNDNRDERMTITDSPT